ncbi:MAG: 30S ribosomal protein S6 [Omnitrophica bacterium RIFCSPHIGHO2_02_FULL_63_14]|nr:MAG: 30S ribosomal protein S6 [Omnitrophica bacterium RIFCSPHIGHO2_02_FULL_63_14]
MRNYEGVFILSPELSADALKGGVSQIQELVTKNGGRIDGLQEWGRKRLAYKIKKKQEGHYVILNFQIDSSQTKKIEQALRLNDNILRYLLINKEEL